MNEHQETHDFDRPYWERHWQQARRNGPGPAPNPYLLRETGALKPGTALDAGCGEGGEARWLAEHGWDVTAADISAEVLARAGRVPSSVDWVQADLTDWTPGRQFDLVMTHYAHPSIPQLAFYDRIAEWVAPGGTLLIVGHLHGHHPAEATATAANITARLAVAKWAIVTADEQARTVTAPDGRSVSLHDVVVRATRHQ
ncbi:class I SAM-dependent methyltransferase [Amycolatopsis saalfeldensis]|uniref:Methyltransferase domain-containing protein n=1 Tax=Amycolatopsis saalfeldensis TaxID=394193 RepID=A0A1H8RER3_9PSEU|nr:class I SAM-dependent methyltransferase [Amycolatopsis saalfeldensis]SEO64523.1 Methyltransferase domain-containing protein [Amycolatopsis saalfeldensis]